MTTPDINALLAKLNQYTGTSPNSLSDAELAYLRQQLTAKKKYGLIWEDKPEAVEQQLLTGLPVLTELPERRVESRKKIETQNSENPNATTVAGQTTLAFVSENSASLGDYHQSPNEAEFSESITDLSPNPSPKTGEGKNAPVNHTLIEGDNLHALTVLNYTHAGAVDVIYIDPPYNTGNKDFKYNDSFVDREDAYRHSKWLSFMAKRLRLAKTLLKDTGVIFISIDDNEQAQLKLLCDEVFGEENFVASLAILNNPKGRVLDKYFSTNHEHCIVYSRQVLQKDSLTLPKSDEKILKDYKLQDEDGRYRNMELRNTHREFGKFNRRNLYYPFYVNPKSLDIKLEYEGGYVEVYPNWDDGFEGCWTWGKDLATKDKRLLVAKKVNGSIKIFRKAYAEVDGEAPKRKLNSVIQEKEFYTEKGQATLTDIFGHSKTFFNSPKPVDFIKTLVQLNNNSNSLVLDFFAGSGTTLHAVMALNAEDGGNRKCILVTNNENNIAEEVCYERNRRVIEGYTNSKGVAVPGLAGNALRYYRTALVGRERTLANKRALMQQATDLLCFKEECFTPQPPKGGVADADTASPSGGWGVIRLFTNYDTGRAMLLVYDPDAIDEAVALLKSLPPTTGKVKVYVFAPASYPYTDEFEEVAHQIELCALPDAIYQAYEQVFNVLRA